MPTNVSDPTLSRPAPKALTVENVAIEGLHPDKKQIGQIAASIKSFGFNVPILVNANQVVAGHGRLLAAKRLGLASVPTIRIDHLDAAQTRAFMIADNRLTEIAQWDDKLLAEQLKELSELNLSFEIEAIGFDTAEIDLRIASLSETAVSDEKPLPVVSGPPVSRLGDIWVLGRHRLLCGDATDSSSYLKLLGSEEAAVIFTDPPYNVKIDGHVSGLGGVRHREFPMAVGEMDKAEFTGFLDSAFHSCARHSRPGAIVYACMDWRYIPELQSAALTSDLESVNLCIWVKPNGGMGSFYRSQHELVFVFKNGPGPRINNVELGRHGRNRTNVWSYASGPGFGRAGEEGRLAALHPTVKPVAMIADALLDSSNRGDVVLDPFLGSGATLMAAERTGRRCFGLELDPLYVDVIVRRWQAYGGDLARHAVTGASFAETESSRTELVEAEAP